MRRAFLASAVVAGALLAAACSDQRSPLSTEPRVSPNFTASPCPRPVDLAVLIVQLFEKVPALKALAPTQKEPPFVITQLAVLVLFGVLTILAAIRFRAPLVSTA